MVLKEADFFTINLINVLSFKMLFQVTLLIINKNILRIM